MTKEYLSATLSGEDLREKIREIKLADKRFLDLSKSQIITYALENLYLQKVPRRRVNKPLSISPLEHTAVVLGSDFSAVDLPDCSFKIEQYPIIVSEKGFILVTEYSGVVVQVFGEIHAQTIP